MDSDATYDIATLARLSGLSVRTIRYYIQQRLLPSSGLRGPQARYDERHLSRLRAIRGLQAEYLPLAEIRRRLDLGTAGGRRRANEPALTAGTPVRVPEADQRSRWERITLSADVEIHVRRPLSRLDNRRLERLLEQARRALAELDPPAPLLPPGQPIVLLPEPGLRGLAEAAARRLGAAERELLARLAVGATIEPAADGNELSPEGEQVLAERAAAAAPAAAVRVVLVRQRLADNWFSHWHARERAAVVSLADWDGELQVSPVAFVAYEAVHHGLRSIAPGFDPLRLAHEETRGCLFDFCATRADIEVKLQAADLCPECRHGLEGAGLPLQACLRLAETIRALATDPPTDVQ
jgi:Ca-activated chloride channel family protein